MTKKFWLVTAISLALASLAAPSEAAMIVVVSGRMVFASGAGVPGGSLEVKSQQLTETVKVGADGKFKVRVRGGSGTFVYKYVTKEPDAQMAEYVWAVTPGWIVVPPDRNTVVQVKIADIKSWRISVSDSRGNLVGGTFAQIWGFNSAPAVQTSDFSGPIVETPRNVTTGTECYFTMDSSGLGACPYFPDLDLEQTDLSTRCWEGRTLETCQIGRLFYRPEPDLRIEYPMYLSQVNDETRTNYVLDDVPTLDLTAPASTKVGATATISLAAVDPVSLAPTVGRVGQSVLVQAASFKGKQVTLLRRDFTNPKKPGKWVKVKTATLSSSKKATFKVAVPRTSQFKVITKAFSAGSETVLVKAKK